MTGFAAIHLLSSALSERIEGRWREVWLWVSSLEYAGWFMGYAIAVPYTGYLPTTVLFAVLLTLRVGYRSAKMLLAAAGSSVFIVLLFKTFLKVNLPSGLIYEQLPDGLRQIMLTYF
jgi:glycosylphosphatidylinositol transamidase (GPIT) subunit GPI8